MYLSTCKIIKSYHKYIVRKENKKGVEEKDFTPVPSWSNLKKNFCLLVTG